MVSESLTHQLQGELFIGEEEERERRRRKKEKKEKEKIDKEEKKEKEKKNEEERGGRGGDIFRNLYGGCFLKHTGENLKELFGSEKKRKARILGGEKDK